MKERLTALLEPLVADLGYELVLLEFSPHKGAASLRLFIDAPGGVGLADCERVSREVAAKLDVEDPIPQSYQLEVSSPGLDRPLSRARDFARFTGSEVRLQLKEPVQGRRRFRGRLMGIEGPAGAERVKLALTDEAPAQRAPGAGRARKNTAAARVGTETPREFALADIEKARLVPQFDFGGGARAPKVNEEGRR